MHVALVAAATAAAADTFNGLEESILQISQANQIVGSR